MPAADRDQQRLACLQAMGLTLYSSRRDLPGAAPSRRVLVALPAPQGRQGPAPAAPPATPADPPKAPPPALDPPPQRPRPPAAPSAERPSTNAVRFRLAAVLAGGAVWLEELGDAPLAREQVALVHAMAAACGWTPGPPRVQEFAWPMHRNPQFDQGDVAASAALQAFLLRLLAEGGAERLLLLGAGAGRRVESLTLPAPALVLPSTRSMLEGAAPKREAWALLRGIAAL